MLQAENFPYCNFCSKENFAVLPEKNDGQIPYAMLVCQHGIIFA